MTVLNVLLVDDDPESLRLLMESLPDTIEEATIRWEQCGEFDDALQRISERRFDVVVSDIYRDRTSATKDAATGDPQGVGVLRDIRERRFCPVLLFTDGTFPTEPPEGPFLKYADKSPGNAQIVEKLGDLIRTGIPELAHRLHDELDSSSGSYLWEFLDTNWPALQDGGLTELNVLDRLVHRRRQYSWATGGFRAWPCRASSRLAMQASWSPEIPTGRSHSNYPARRGADAPVLECQYGSILLASPRFVRSRDSCLRL